MRTLLLLRSWLCHLLTFTFFFCCGVVSAQSVNLQNGLVAYYPFNGNANDAGGNNIHGVVNGAQLTTDRFGNANGAYRFTGTNSYIQLPFSQLYNFKPTDAYSLSVWVQHEASSGPRALIVKSPYAANFYNSQWNYGVYLSDFDQLHAGYHDNLAIKSNLSLTAGEACWYLITSTYDNGRWKLYVNGKLEGENLTQTRKILQDGASSIAFGRKGEASGDYYTGKLDDVRIYNRALNDDEVAALYTQGSPCVSPVVTAAFTTPDTVCVNTPVTVQNQSVNASGYYWNFNAASVKTLPDAVNLGNISGKLNVPVFGDIVQANGNYYVFVVNHNNFELTRYDFGNSLLNTPTAVTVNVPYSYKNPEGIQVVFNENKWYAFVVGGNPQLSGTAFFLKIEFGADVTNTNPTVTNLGNIGSMLFPHDLYMFKDGAAWYGFAVNKDGNSITRLSFTESFNNTPTGVNLGTFNGVLKDPVGIYCIKNSEEWYAFVTNDNDNGGLVRLDFGKSLLNAPTANALTTNIPVTHLRDVHIMQYCDGISGFVIDGGKNYLYRLDFGNSITSNPVATSYGNAGSLSFPHSLSKFFRVGGDLYSFITNAYNNTMTRVRFSSANALPSQVFSVANPAAYTYATPGTYNINLVVNEGLPTQASFCKNIVVKDCTPPVTAAFSAPDTVCVNTPVTVKNISVNAGTHYWNFNSADINKQPVSVNLGNIGNKFVMPVFTDVVEVNGNYYVFVVNHIPSGITRLDFGNSLLNTPTAVSLNLNGNLPTSAEGIQVIFNENKWYAFVVGGNLINAPSFLVKMEFGADLTNTTPVVTNLGNIGEMGYPLDLYMFKDGDNWYGLTVNLTNNTLVRLNFTNSFNNMPTGVNLGTINGMLSGPTGIYPVKVNGQWHVFASNGVGAGIVRLDFGSSLLNVPTGTLLTTNTQLSNIKDLNILTSCEGFAGFAVDGVTNQLFKLDFGSSITSMPTVTSYGNTGNLSFPHSLSKMFRVGGDLYSFIPNVTNNTLTRVRFSSSTVVNGSVSTLATPPAVTYTTPGTYTINLVLNEGLATQASFCKRVIVIAPYAKVAIKDTVVCTDSAVLKTRFVTSRTWSTGAVTDSIVIKKDGTYWVSADAYGCGARDTFVYAFKGLKPVSLGNDTTFCDGGKAVKTLNIADVTYLWHNGSTANSQTLTTEGKYWVRVKNTWCSTSDTLQVKVIALPEVKLMADTAICEKDIFAVRADMLKYTDSLRWTPQTGLQSATTANPQASPAVTTEYKLTAYNKYCAKTDTVLVTVRKLPVLQLNKDTTVCAGQPVPLKVSGAAVYAWKAAEGITNAALAAQSVRPAANTRYYVKGTSVDGCVSNDSVLVGVVAMPSIKLMADTAFCSKSSFTVRAEQMQYTDSIQWVPATGLSAANIAAPVASPNATTSYTATVYNRFCKVVDDITITVKALPELKLRADTAICRGDSIRIPASGNAVAYQWTGSADLKDANSAAPLATPQVATRYYVKATGANSCVTEGSVWVGVNVPVTFALSPEKVTVCSGDNVKLSVTGNGAYRWLIPGQENNTSAVLTLKPEQPGSYGVQVYDAGCKRTDTLYSTVMLNEKPALVVTASNDIDCIQGEARLTVTGGASYNWYPAATLSGANSYNPVAKTDTSTWYHVEATGFNGCKSEDSVLVRVVKDNFNAYPIANAFTPNGDGKNDCFGVNKWGLIKSMQFSVYNRLGNRVFNSSDPYSCWDGRYKGLMQLTGTYVYIIQANTLCGTVSRKGTVVLIR